MLIFLTLSIMAQLISRIACSYPIGQFHPHLTMQLPTSVFQHTLQQSSLKFFANYSGSIYYLQYSIQTSNMIQNKSVLHKPQGQYQIFDNKYSIKYKEVIGAETYYIEQYYRTDDHSTILIINSSEIQFHKQVHLLLNGNIMKQTTQQNSSLYLIDFSMGAYLKLYELDRNYSKIYVESITNIYLVENSSLYYLSKGQTQPQFIQHYQFLIYMQMNDIKTHLIVSSFGSSIFQLKIDIYDVRNFGLVDSYEISLQLTDFPQILDLNDNSKVFVVGMMNEAYALCYIDTRQCYNFDGEVNTGSLATNPFGPHIDSLQFLNQSCLNIISDNKIHIYMNTDDIWANLSSGSPQQQFIFPNQSQTIVINSSQTPPHFNQTQTQLSTNQTNSSYNQITPIYRISYEKRQVFKYPGQTAINNSSESNIMNGVISFPNIKRLFKIVNPLFLFVEDYWFFSYHNRSYSPNIHIAFDTIREINDAKILPSIIYETTEYLKSYISFSKVFNSSHYAGFTPDNFIKKQGASVHFLLNTEDIVIWNYLYNMIFFVMIKIALKICPKRLTKIHSFLDEKAHISNLWLILIQNNVLYLSFLAFCQLSVPSLINFSDKIKMLVTVMVLFCVLIYCVAGYFLIQKYLDKHYWPVFLEYNSATKSSCHYMVINLMFRHFCMGFAHGYLLNNPATQTMVILAIDTISLAILLMYRKTGVCNIATTLLLMYYLSRLVFDAIVLNEVGIQYKMEQIQSILLYGMIILISILFFWYTFLNAIDFWKINKDVLKKKKSKKQKVNPNKVHPYLQQTNKQNQQNLVDNQLTVSNLNIQKEKKSIRNIIVVEKIEKEEAVQYQQVSLFNKKGTIINRSQQNQKQNQEKLPKNQNCIIFDIEEEDTDKQE